LPDIGYSFAAFHQQYLSEQALGRRDLDGDSGMGRFTTFIKDETGAVTVDWVVLTAGVVGMAMAFMPPIRDAIVNMAIYIGQTIDAYHVFLEEDES
jgi:hypothetical protein